MGKLLIIRWKLFYFFPLVSWLELAGEMLMMSTIHNSEEGGTVQWQSIRSPPYLNSEDWFSYLDESSCANSMVGLSRLHDCTIALHMPWRAHWEIVRRPKHCNPSNFCMTSLKLLFSDCCNFLGQIEVEAHLFLPTLKYTSSVFFSFRHLNLPFYLQQKK